LNLNEKGEYHIDTASSYNNIALVYESKGDYAKALEFHQKSLEIR
jgi:tetratricopeptide (TPR) repeat protein